MGNDGIHDVLHCLCGAKPVIERKPIPDGFPCDALFKYKCPNCKEKELPWLGQWRDCGALQEWNRIAPKRSYHKRTIAYNEHGVCVTEPYKTYEWRDKKRAYCHITVNVYLDNSMYYYSYGYYYNNGGCGSGLWISEHGFPSLELAKRHAMKTFSKREKSLRKIAKELLFPCVQLELF